MVWYGISAGTEFLGGAFGWSEPLYRTWYLIGAVYVAAWLGLGTMYLLGKTRFGYGAAFSVLLAGLFTVLAQAKAQYTDTGILPYAAFAIATVGAILIVIETYRGTGRWAWIAGALIIGGSVVAIPIVLTAAIPPPGYALDANGIPVGTAMPGSVRLLTPLFNVTGGFALALGALFSTYMYMPKKRVMRYDLARSRGIGRFLANLAIAPVAITVNLLASDPGHRHRPVRRQAQLARPRDDPAGDRRLHPVADVGPVALRLHADLLPGRAAGRDLPVRRHARLGRGLPRVPDPVHPPRVQGAARGGLTVAIRRPGRPPPTRSGPDPARDSCGSRSAD